MAFADTFHRSAWRRLSNIVSAGLLCVTIAACSAPSLPVTTPDPYETRNRKVHNFNKALDQNIVRPTAFGYGDVAPGPLRNGIQNFALNLGIPSDIVNSLLQGIAVGVIWVPLTLVTFSNMSAANLAEGTAVYHLLRNIGSSFFISICVAEIVRATSTNYSRMVELVNPYNKALALPWVTGGWDYETVSGLAKLSKEINRQAAMIGYINAFGLYTACSALAEWMPEVWPAPLCCSMRRATPMAWSMSCTTTQPKIGESFSFSSTWPACGWAMGQTSAWQSTGTCTPAACAISNAGRPTTLPLNLPPGKAWF